MKNYVVVIPDWGNDAEWKGFDKKREAIEEARVMGKERRPKGALVYWQWQTSLFGFSIEVSRKVFSSK